MMNKNIQVSIITPCFNCEHYIYKTYESIKGQEFLDWEWIAIDDCSSDGTLEILYNIAAYDERVKIIKNDENSGAAITRNKGIEQSKGEYLAFIDSDDYWHKSKLNEQLKFMINNKVDFSFTAYQLVDNEGLLLGKIVDSNQVDPVNYSDMLKKKATIGCSTVMLKMSAFNKIEMPDIRTGQDYALWLKLLKCNKSAHPLNKVLTYYRIVPNSISRNKFRKAIRQWSIYRNIEKIGVFKSSYLFFFYAWRAVFKK